MSQNPISLAQGAYLNFTANVVRYIMIQKNFIKMSKISKRIQQNQLPPSPLNNQSPSEIVLKGKNRKNAAFNQAMYYTNLGMCWRDVCDKVADEFGYKRDSSFVDKIVGEARKLIKEKQEEYAKGVAQRNIARIETIIQECMAEGNKALALKALDLLGKTTNLYNTNIKIDNEENKSFEIKLTNNGN